MIRYRISCPNRLSHIVHIELAFETETSTDLLELCLPAWRPGRYEMANYAKNVVKTEAYTSDGIPLKIRKIAKSSWVVETSGAQAVLVRYQYYAHQMDAGNSWLHEEQLYLNFINCLMYLPGRLHEEVSIELDVPASFDKACALRQEGNRLIAKSYYEAVDSPVIASNQLQHLTYVAEGVTFHLYYIGVIDLDEHRLLEDFRKFSTSQLALFGDLPTTDYYFLFQFLPYRFYHGVEHANSTVITIGTDTGEQTEEFYENLLGISSHELFHAWNVTRIRPGELLPYDFSKENYFDTGFVAEGFTTYYGDLMLTRSGVYDSSWYLAVLNKLLKRHFLNLGRLNLAVTYSSMDLWLDGYVAGVPNRKGSIYVEGAVIAFMIDLALRLNSKDRYSLDDIMRDLWSNFYKQNRGYKKSDIRELMQKYGGLPMNDFFEAHIDGTEPTEGTLKPLANAHGLRLVEKLPEHLHERELGLRLKIEDEKVLITHIHPESVAYRWLSTDDEIVEVNGESTPSKMIAAFGETNHMRLRRGRKLLEADLLAQGQGRYYHWFELEINKTATPAEIKRLHSWLNQ